MTTAAAASIVTPATAALAERAMTVSLHLSAWQAQRLDRKITAEVLQQRGAAKDAGRFQKHLVPPSALEPIQKAHSEARACHYALTLPWGEEGMRILSAMAFFDYMKAMNEKHAKCEKLYGEFADIFPQLFAEAPARLGPELFSLSDFPDPRTIRERFAFRLEIMPVPAKEDFRVSIGEAAEKRIRESIEETVRNRYAEAQHDLWTRVLDTTKHFAETLADPKKVFRNTTVQKLIDLATTAPKLSLNPDPALEQLCEELRTLAERGSPDDYRNNPLLRQATATQAQNKLAELEAAMANAAGAFSFA